MAGGPVSAKEATKGTLPVRPRKRAGFFGTDRQLSACLLNNHSPNVLYFNGFHKSLRCRQVRAHTIRLLPVWHPYSARIPGLSYVR